jgi:predicted MPP superfamily phosphohydrolase
LVEPYWPEVERLQVETAKLPPGAGSVRLVLLADTHCDAVARVEPRIAEIVRGLEPHAIVFGGDAVNCPEGLTHFKALMKQLAGIAPTWAVRGNWETWWFPGLDLLGGTGVGALDGRAVPVRAGAAEIWLAGFPVLDDRAGFSPEINAAQARRALSAVPPGRFTVFVHHYPEIAELGVRQGADLGLAGDTHGGQVRLPLLGELVRINRMGRYWAAGAHALPGGGTLYVNRGLGMEGGSAPRMRFRCRPEITLIEIVPADQPPRHQDTKKD